MKLWWHPPLDTFTDFVHEVLHGACDGYLWAKENPRKFWGILIAGAIIGIAGVKWNTP